MMANTILQIISSISITIVAVFIIVLVIMANKKEKHIMIISYQITGYIGYECQEFYGNRKVETFTELMNRIDRENPEHNPPIITNVSVI